MPRHNNLRLEQIDTPHCGFKIVDLEPEQPPVAIWLIISIPDRTVVMIDVKAVQSEDQKTSRFRTRPHRDRSCSQAISDTSGCWLRHQ